MNALLPVLHLLAAVLWVGGMFFAHWIVRPAAQPLDIPERVALWSRILAGFFPMVWGLVIVLPLTGYGLAFHFYGGLANLGHHILIMQVLAWIMIAVFLIVYFGPYREMRRAVRQHLFPEAGLYMERIRRAMGLNLTLGLIVVVVAVAGRY